MKAKIKTKNNIYDSMIFAYIPKGWKTKAVVFDEINEKLCLIDYWPKISLLQRTRGVFVFDSQCDGWQNDEKIYGYDWFVKTPNIIKLIKKGKKIDEKILARCKEMQSAVKIESKGVIENEVDIKNILSLSLNFHDAYVQEFIKEENKIIINLNTTWGCGIIFTIEGEPKTNLFQSFGNGGEILDSSMFIENGMIFWTNYGDMHNSKDIVGECAYFSAKQVFWEAIIY